MLMRRGVISGMWVLLSIRGDEEGTGRRKEEQEDEERMHDEGTGGGID